MAKAILRVECTRCSRKGRYSVRKLIAQYGPAVIVQSASAQVQNTANRLSKLRPHLKALFELCERKFGHPDVIPFPPHALQLRLPDLPVPKHDVHQRARNSEPHVGHLLPSIGWLLISVSPRGSETH